ncbi:MAG TPA: DUF6134 family protein [Pelagibacteraceae bacterium]|nr:DUF6134 family protein [Pelagibacteraceae bacterium]
MIKKLFLLAILFLTQLSFSSAFAHVLHYQKLNKLEYDLFRNDQLIGQHIYVFNRSGRNLTVHGKINFEIKILDITLYRYSAESQEKYVNGKFESFSATTNQNEKKKFSKIYKKENKFFIEGSSYKGEAPEDFIVGSWWNHSIIKYGVQISMGSGRIIKQNVSFVAKEAIEINNKEYSALKFNFSSKDQSLSKDKKLNMDVWYDEKTLIWLKANYIKRGNWEYRLKHVE